MKKLFTIRGIAITSFIFVSLFTSAYALDPAGGFKSLADVIDVVTNRLLKSLATLFATAAMVAFFFGLVQYIWGAREGEPAKITKGNIFMRWSLLALFVMFSIWGMILYVQKLFQIDGQNTIIIPSIQTDGSLAPNLPPSPVNPSPNNPNLPPSPVNSNLVSKDGTCSVTANCQLGLTCKDATSAEGVVLKTCQ
jgi:succinate dehydrogenase/fumarate reductase cytochrome b subunit